MPKFHALAVAGFVWLSLLTIHVMTFSSQFIDGPLPSKALNTSLFGTPPTPAKKEQANSDWPGVAAEELGRPLVKVGQNFVGTRARQLVLQHLDEFVSVYAKRPDKVNMCGIRLNHALALFVVIRQLQPTTIIESGVNAGQSTYIMRHAAPEAKIIAIDPLDTPICKQGTRWIDETKLVYYTGKNFVDFADINWTAIIGRREIDPK
jgi:hypothetical protein